MTASHAQVIAASRGFCASDARCSRPALVADDDAPGTRRCGVHARERLEAAA